MIYNWDSYLKNEIPVDEYFIFVGETPLKTLERSSVTYTEMGDQLADSTSVFCADGIPEVIAHLFNDWLPSFPTSTREFYLYEWYRDRVKELGEIVVGWEQIVINLRVPLDRGEGECS